MLSYGSQVDELVEPVLVAAIVVLLEPSEDWAYAEVRPPSPLIMAKAKASAITPAVREIVSRTVFSLLVPPDRAVGIFIENKVCHTCALGGGVGGVSIQRLGVPV